MIKVHPPGTFFDYPFCGCNEYIKNDKFELPKCQDYHNDTEECIEGENCHTPCHEEYKRTDGKCSAFKQKY